MSKLYDVSSKPYRHWSFVLYPQEDETHLSALNYIRENFEYAEIVHDKDLTENGDLKKTHTHVVISFPNAVWASSLEKQLGIHIIGSNVSTVLKSALLYLIHKGVPEKYQYSLDDVTGSLKSVLERSLRTYDKVNENEGVLSIISFIDSFPSYMPLSFLITFCCNNNMYDVFRRSQYTFIKLLEQHNRYMSDTQNYIPEFSDNPNM